MYNFLFMTNAKFTLYHLFLQIYLPVNLGAYYHCTKGIHVLCYFASQTVLSTVHFVILLSSIQLNILPQKLIVHSFSSYEFHSSFHGVFWPTFSYFFLLFSRTAQPNLSSVGAGNMRQ